MKKIYSIIIDRLCQIGQKGGQIQRYSYFVSFYSESADFLLMLSGNWLKSLVAGFINPPNFMLVVTTHWCSYFCLVTVITYQMNKLAWSILGFSLNWDYLTLDIDLNWLGTGLDIGHDLAREFSLSRTWPMKRDILGL